METNQRVPILKGKPFFEQLKLSINFIDTKMKSIENCVKTSNTDEEYCYVKKMLNIVDKYNDDVNNLARSIKLKNCVKRNCSEFDDEIQNLKEILRCKEIDYQLEPFKYKKNQQQQTLNDLKSNYRTNQPMLIQSNQTNQSNQSNIKIQMNNFTSQEQRLKLLNKTNFNEELNIHSAMKLSNLNRPTNHRDNQTIDLNGLQNVNNSNVLIKKNTNSSSLKKRDTFLLKDNQTENTIKKPVSTVPPNQIKKQDQPINQSDLTNESFDPTNQFSFDFKLPYNKLKNNFYPSNSNFSVDESLEIEFTPGLKTKRTCKKKPYLNESNASNQDLHTLQFDNSMKSDLMDKPNLTAKLITTKKPEDTYHIKSSDEKPIDSMKEENNDKFNKPQMTFLMKQDLSFKEQKIDTVSSPKNLERFDEKLRSHKLSTPKKPPNFDLMF